MAAAEDGFWTLVPSNIHAMIVQAMPEELLNSATSSYNGPNELQSKYSFLATKLQSHVEQQQSRNANPSISLHALGMLYLEQGQYPAAETIWRSMLWPQDPSQPDLATRMNMAFTLNKQKKYAGAEDELRQVSGIVENKLGTDSPQGLGLKRMLMESLAGQGKTEEAHQLYLQTETLVDRLTGDQKESDTEALQAVKSEFGPF